MLLTKKCCLYTSARLEAERHVLASSGTPDPVGEWNEQHWWPWAAARYLEHLHGKTFWSQFGDEDFAFLGGEDALHTGQANPIAQQAHMLNELLDRPTAASPEVCCEHARELERRVDELRAGVALETDQHGGFRLET